MLVVAPMRSQWHAGIGHARSSTQPFTSKLQLTRAMRWCLHAEGPPVLCNLDESRLRLARVERIKFLKSMQGVRVYVHQRLRELSGVGWSRVEWSRAGRSWAQRSGVSECMRAHGCFVAFTCGR